MTRIFEIATVFIRIGFVRATIHLDGGTPKPSSRDVLYVTLEGIKVIALLPYGLKQFNKYEFSIINTR